MRKTDINDAIMYARSYCAEYVKSGDFDPVHALSGKSDRRQKLFIECCAFLNEIETAAETFTRTRDKITFSE